MGKVRSAVQCSRKSKRKHCLTAKQKRYLKLKRGLDFGMSLGACVVLSPALLALSAAIKLDSRGPVLFKQKRVGIHKTYFSIYKFRTMRIDTPKDTPTHLLADPDQYITRMGHFLRRSSLDELPQLFNILKGDMSFAGPRPERPEIMEEYCKEIPEFAFRTRVKAGLTGYAQVYGKYNTTPYDKLKLDLFYISNYSMWTDIKLILMTLKIVLKKDATEGVNEELTGNEEDSSIINQNMEKTTRNIIKK